MRASRFSLVRTLGVALVLILVTGCASLGAPAGSASPELVATPNTAPVSPPQSVTDQLGWSDSINAKDGSFYRIYTLNLDADQVVKLSVTSHRFVPVLTLYAPDGTLLQGAINEFGERTTPAIVTQRIIRGGPHLLVVSSAEPRGVGQFELQSELLDLQANLDFQFPGTLNGELVGGLDRHPDTNASMQVIPFTVYDDVRAQFNLTSSDFDTYLSLVDADTGEELAYNDDWGFGTDSQIIHSLTAGAYELWVSAYSPGGMGSYTLIGTRSEPPPPPQALRLGTPQEGELSTRQPIQDEFITGNPYTVEVTADAILEVIMTSDGVDSYLYLTDAHNEIIAEDDDSGGDLNARLVVTLTPGTYTVWASSYYEDDVGSYQLTADLRPATGTDEDA